MEINERTGVHVLQHEGDLTIFEAAEFHETLVKLVRKDGPLELDLSSIERVDSSGIQLMLAASRENRFSITGMTEAVNQKLASVGCAHLIKSSEK